MPDLKRELHKALVDKLVCPVCRAPMQVTEDGRSLACTAESPTGKRHLFDGSAGGYVHLAPAHGGGGDSREAVRARTAFLTHGYYGPARDALVSLVEQYTPSRASVLDAGCGEGYYSNAIAEAGHPTVGVDLSKFATDAAAKSARAYRMQTGNDPMTLYAVGSVFELPVADASFDTVTNIFAPCAPTEYARVLRSGGHLILAGAGERHLLGLKELIYDDPYLNQPRRDLPEEGSGLTLVDKQTVTFSVTVKGQEHLQALFSMTPYYWRTSRDGHSRLADATELETLVSFDFHVYKKH